MTPHSIWYHVPWRGGRNRGVNLPSLWANFSLLPTFWANFSLLPKRLPHIFSLFGNGPKLQEWFQSCFILFDNQIGDWNLACQCVGLSPGQTDFQVEHLGLLVTPFGQALHALALTCDHFGRDQICTQVNASFLRFGHPTQVSSQVQLATTCESIWSGL